MKKAYVTIISIFFLNTIVLISCNNSADKNDKNQTTVADTSKQSQQSGIVYTCSMHPEIISDKPGKCPKCGDMELIEKK